MSPPSDPQQPAESGAAPLPSSALTRRRLVLLASGLLAGPLGARAGAAPPTPSKPPCRREQNFGRWRVRAEVSEAEVWCTGDVYPSHTPTFSLRGSRVRFLVAPALKSAYRSRGLSSDRPHEIRLEILVDDEVRGTFRREESNGNLIFGPWTVSQVVGWLRGRSLRYRVHYRMPDAQWKTFPWKVYVSPELPTEGLVSALVRAERWQGELARKKKAGECASSAGCFLTTACCELAGLPDDCWELETLRRFRDEVLLASPEGRMDVARYYARAPEVLARLRDAPDRERVLARVYAGTIFPCALAARLGLHGWARRRYRAMMETLGA